jgi:hypothetical protein
LAKHWFIRFCITAHNAINLQIKWTTKISARPFASGLIDYNLFIPRSDKLKQKCFKIMGKNTFVPNRNS